MRVVILHDEMHAQRIRGVIFAGLMPVSVEDFLKRGNRLRIRDKAAELTSEVEGAAVDIHGADEGSLLVRQQELRVKAQMLLLADLDAISRHEPEGGKCVEDVPGADAMLAATDHAHTNAPAMRLDQPVH